MADIELSLLVLIPKTIHGKPLNLVNLGDLVKRPKGGGLPTEYYYIWDAVIIASGQQATTRSHWVLMTKDVIEGSRNKSYKEQQALVAEVNKKTGMNEYEVPNALDAAIVSGLVPGACPRLNGIHWLPKFRNARIVPIVLISLCRWPATGRSSPSKRTRVTSRTSSPRPA